MASTRFWLLLLLIGGLAAADTVADLVARLSANNDHEAADKLADLGPAARDAIPTLTAAVDSSDAELSWRAGWALSRIGPDAAAAAPALVIAALRRDGLPRAAACIALKRLGAAGAEAVLASMQGAPVSERGRYLDLLQVVSPRPPQTVPLLLSLLSQEEEKVCDILGSMGTSAAPAAPALVQILKENALHKGAADALVAIGEASVPSLRALALDADAAAEARGAALLSLVKSGGGGVVCAKECLLKTKDEAVWDSFLPCVSEVGIGATPLASVIEEHIANAGRPPSGTVDALLSMGPTGETVLGRLLLDSRGEEMDRMDLVLQLRGNTSPRVVPWLLRLADREQPRLVRLAAFRALAGCPIDRDSVNGAVVLADRALSVDPEAGCELAGNIGPDAEPLVDKVRSLLKDRALRLRASAASALCRIGVGGEAEAAILAEAIEEARSSGDAEDYRHALRCIADARAPVGSCLAPLLQALDREDVLSTNIASMGVLLILPALAEADRRRALDALGRRGRVPARGIQLLDDIPTLIDLLTIDWAARPAADRLVVLRSDSWEPLIGALDGRRGQGVAAQTLIRIDPSRADEHVWSIALGTNPISHDLKTVLRARRQVASSHLMTALSRGDWASRAEAASLLGDLGCTEAVPILRDLVRQDGGGALREEMLWALDALLPQR